jgi:hypothetical protein
MKEHVHIVGPQYERRRRECVRERAREREGGERDRAHEIERAALKGYRRALGGNNLTPLADLRKI